MLIWDGLVLTGDGDGVLSEMLLSAIFKEELALQTPNATTNPNRIPAMTAYDISFLMNFKTI